MSQAYGATVSGCLATECQAVNRSPQITPGAKTAFGIDYTTLALRFESTIY